MACLGCIYSSGVHLFWLHCSALWLWALTCVCLVRPPASAAIPTDWCWPPHSGPCLPTDGCSGACLPTGGCLPPRMRCLPHHRWVLTNKLQWNFQYRTLKKISKGGQSSYSFSITLENGGPLCSGDTLLNSFVCVLSSEFVNLSS